VVTVEIIKDSIQLIKMTDEEYFSEKYKEYISNSKLSLIDPSEGGSIEKYNSGFQGDYNESFDLGSAVHAMVLQPDYYNIAPVNKPTGKLGLFADKAYNLLNSGMVMSEIINKASEEANYYSGKLTDKRIVSALDACNPYWKERREFEKTLLTDLDNRIEQIYLSAPMQAKFNSCMLGITNNRKIQDTLYPSGLFEAAEVFNEYAILCEIEFINEDTGEIKTLKVKAKLDNFTIDHEKKEITLNDLKTTGKPVKYFMGNKVNVQDEEGNFKLVWYDGSFQKYHYYRQLGLYSWMMICAVKHLYNHDYKLKCNILVVETIPEFNSKVYPISNRHIKQGLEEFKKLLTLVVNG
jgi:hypothetical protein